MDRSHTVTRLLVVFALVTSVCANAFPLDTSQPAVQTFADRLAKEGFPRSEMLGWLGQIDVKPGILGAMDRPSTSRTWAQFAPNFINPKRIGQGVAFWKTQAAVLDRAQCTYGVPASIIVGILGAETSYGRDTGRWRAIDALGTLAFHYPRRADYFQDELLALLQLSRDEGLLPTQALSSYAGALGWPQFMPSNVRALAVDFDGDGHRNLWTGGADAIGSVAHYLKEKGWQEGAPVALRATVTAQREALDKLLANRFQLQYTLMELKSMGVEPSTPVEDDSVKALLFRLETANGPEYWLGLQNFYTITRYNKSVNYAMAVWKLGESVKSLLPITAPPPAKPNARSGP